MLSKFSRILKRFKGLFYHTFRLYKLSLNNERVRSGKAEIVFTDEFISKLCLNYNENNLKEAADKLLSGEYNLFGDTTVKPCDLSELWFTDFYSGYIWRPNSYFKNTVIRPSENLRADIKVPWESARLHHLVTLALAYRNTGSESYLDKLIQDLESFIQHNPPSIGPNWFYSMEVSIRIFNIKLALDIIHSKNDKINIEKYSSYLAYSAIHILNNLEWRGGIRNNHYLISLIGLFVISLSFKNSFYFRKSANFSFKEINTELSYHIYKDGGGAEQSTSYHRLNLEMLSYFFEIVNIHDFQFSSFLQVTSLFGNFFCPIELKLRRFRCGLSIYKSAVAFFNILKLDDGSYPLIGDNDSGRIVKLYKTGGWHYCNYFSSFIKLPNHKPGFLLSNKKKFVYLDNDCKSLLNISIKNNNFDSFLFEEFGLLVIRSKNTLLSIKLPPKGRVINGHSHEDDYSLCLYCEGEWLYQDNGTYSYNENRELYFLEKSEKSHNVQLPDFLSGEYEVDKYLAASVQNVSVRLNGAVLYIVSIDSNKFQVHMNKEVFLNETEIYPDYKVKKK